MLRKFRPPSLENLVMALAVPMMIVSTSAAIVCFALAGTNRKDPTGYAEFDLWTSLSAAIHQAAYRQKKIISIRILRSN